MCTVVNIFQVYSIWRLGITSFTQTDGITFYRLESPVYSKKMQWSNNTPYFLTEIIYTYEVDHIFNPAVIHDNFMIWECFPLCVGNPPSTGRFPRKRSTVRSFVNLSQLSKNGRVPSDSRGHDVRCSCTVTVMFRQYLPGVSKFEKRHVCDILQSSNQKYSWIHDPSLQFDGAYRYS